MFLIGMRFIIQCNTFGWDKKISIVLSEKNKINCYVRLAESKNIRFTHTQHIYMYVCRSLEGYIETRKLLGQTKNL